MAAALPPASEARGDVNVAAAAPDGHAAPTLTLAPEALARVRDVLARRKAGQRTLIGLVGEPGAGKSTVAAALSVALQDTVALAVVPMDGFHLANAELARLGRAERKGAPDTFDAAGYLALLHRLKRTPEPDAGTAAPIIYAPAFHREIEEAVAGEIAVPPETQLIITEGNYLLLDEPNWREVRAMLDDIWFIATPQPQRHAQLLARHMAHGRTREAALDWIAHTDEPNARRIAASVQAAQTAGIDLFVLPVAAA
ncbi:nucleoside/nucleotide kinase family protein [Robbsia andropogonis]|nr:nucleoside/nucleotide kinase family protein [Robbsia andropogonis]MCP1120899.1 nucleoside/nucleotide kinase family protein [Robbsia andropogonis]